MFILRPPGIARRACLLGALILPAAWVQPVHPQDYQEWRRIAMPWGTPPTPRPPDSEFRRVLPPEPGEPQFDDQASRRGLAVWWRPASVLTFGHVPPTSRDLRRRPIVRTPPGEREPIVLGLWGIRDVGPVQVRVASSPFAATIRRVEFVSRLVPPPPVPDGRLLSLGTFLPLADSAEVKAGTNAVFWITFEVPQDAAAGHFSVKLQLTIGDSAEVVDLAVDVHVLDYVLPRADIAYGMYFGTRHVPAHRNHGSPELLRAYWRDMASHGMTSIALISYGGRLITPDGKLNLDGHLDVKHVEQMMAEGLLHGDVPIAWLDGNGSFTGYYKEYHGAEKGCGDPAALTAFLGEWKSRRYPELLLYGSDEPAVMDEDLQAIRMTQPLRAAGLRNITAVQDDRVAEAFLDYFDVFLAYGGTITPRLQLAAAASGTELWTYFPLRGRGNAPASRFFAGLYTWALGLKGNFHWIYCASGPQDYWEAEHGDTEWVFVLPGDHGPVPSIEWEARREGVEDYRTLRHLESLIGAKPEHPAARRAAAWIGRIRSRVDWCLGRDLPPSFGWDNKELWPICPGFDPWELSVIRAEAQDHIVGLLNSS